MSPVENKEHKPGPIGKERSLKNRKVKDAQQVEPEGQEKLGPVAVRSADPATTKETKAASEMSAEIGTMISVSSAEYATNVKVSGAGAPSAARAECVQSRSRVLFSLSHIGSSPHPVHYCSILERSLCSMVCMCDVKKFLTVISFCKNLLFQIIQ